MLLLCFSYNRGVGGVDLSRRQLFCAIFHTCTSNSIELFRSSLI